MSRAKDNRHIQNIDQGDTGAFNIISEENSFCVIQISISLGRESLPQIIEFESFQNGMWRSDAGGDRISIS